ncbi:MAG: TIM-barrel domain-containing protein [bacterium]
MKTSIKLILSFLFLTCVLFAQKYDPVANENAIVKIDKARFTVLTPRVIRMEWSEDKIFEDHASLVFVNRNLPVPNFSKEIKDNLLTIKTDELKLIYKLGTCEFSPENLSVEFMIGGVLKKWIFGMENKENLLGTTRTLDGADGDNYTYENKKIQLEEGIISREGWCCIDDSQKPLFDNSDYPWVMPRPEKKYQDYYFFGYGYNYKQAMKDFTEVAGKIALPPKFVFGYWYSRYWPYTDTEMRELVETFESLNIPLDILVVDMDWHITSLPEFFKDGERVRDQAGQRIGWTGFTWDKNFFPYPDNFLKWTEAKRLKTCLNIHPASGIQPHEEKYSEMAKAVGIDPASKQYVPFNITDKEWAKHYFDIILHPMEKMGVDFWWLDWQQWGSTAIPGVNPTFYLNYVHYSDMERQNQKRPLIYHRYGGLGNHRYQIGFSGDTHITWNSLNYQSYFTVTASNVGFGYWGHDIGGHMGSNENDPELLTRWFQSGVFSPILKSHATHDEGIKRKIWEYPPVNFFIMRDFIKLRYSLIPYIYTNARKAYDDGISICRPLYYEEPEKDESYQFPNEYYFGDDIIAFPITRPIGEDSLFAVQKIWLPKGNWYEWSGGTILEGEKTINRAFTIDEIPLYVKEGAIIPMQLDMKNTSEKKVDPLILNIFPGEKGATRIYDDEGDSQYFKNGEFTFTPVCFEKVKNKIELTIEPVEGSFPGMLTNRSYELRFINVFPPEKITINGVLIEQSSILDPGKWIYSGEELTLKILTGSFDVNKKTSIEVTLPDYEPELLDNKIAKFKRLYLFTKFLAGKRTFWAQEVWNDAYNPSGVIIRSAQTGLLISTEPEKIVWELQTFETNWQQILKMLEAKSVENDLFKPYYDLLKASE